MYTPLNVCVEKLEFAGIYLFFLFLLQTFSFRNTDEYKISIAEYISYHQENMPIKSIPLHIPLFIAKLGSTWVHVYLFLLFLILNKLWERKRTASHCTYNQYFERTYNIQTFERTYNIFERTYNIFAYLYLFSQSNFRVLILKNMSRLI